MTLALAWMRPDAPYMPIVTAGLLSVLDGARARWEDGLIVETDSTIDGVAEALAFAPLPNVGAIAWPSGAGQSLASALAAFEDPLEGFSELCDAASGQEERLLRALATDQARRTPLGPPARNRLLAGAKADLSPFRWVLPVDAAGLAAELATGPSFVGNDSGPCLGLAPEVHTFGGMVGRNASTIGAASPLLALLLRHGLLALPPNGARPTPGRGAGGPLLDEKQRLVWPIWTLPLDLPALRAVFTWAEVHAPEPDADLLAARGVAMIYRSEPVALSDTVSVFRWGQRVA